CSIPAGLSVDSDGGVPTSVGEGSGRHSGGRTVAPKEIRALALGLLVAAVASAVAPTHPVYNPPIRKFLLGAMALTAAMWAREAARWSSPATRDANETEFVVSFDDHVISLGYPDGSSDSARFDELERISIEPYDNPYHDWWMGPFFVVLHERG